MMSFRTLTPSHHPSPSTAFAAETLLSISSTHPFPPEKMLRATFQGHTNHTVENFSRYMEIFETLDPDQVHQIITTHTVANGFFKKVLSFTKPAKLAHLLRHLRTRFIDLFKAGPTPLKDYLKSGPFLKFEQFEMMARQLSLSLGQLDLLLPPDSFVTIVKECDAQVDQLTKCRNRIFTESFKVHLAVFETLRLFKNSRDSSWSREEIEVIDHLLSACSPSPYLTVTQLIEGTPIKDLLAPIKSWIKDQCPQLFRSTYLIANQFVQEAQFDQYLQEVERQIANLQIAEKPDAFAQQIGCLMEQVYSLPRLAASNQIQAHLRVCQNFETLMQSETIQSLFTYDEIKELALQTVNPITKFFSQEQLQTHVDRCLLQATQRLCQQAGHVSFQFFQQLGSSIHENNQLEKEIEAHFKELEKNLSVVDCFPTLSLLYMQLNDLRKKYETLAADPLFQQYTSMYINFQYLKEATEGSVQIHQDYLDRCISLLKISSPLPLDFISAADPVGQWMRRFNFEVRQFRAMITSQRSIGIFQEYLDNPLVNFGPIGQQMENANSFLYGDCYFLTGQQL